jgi:hypothetical protein
MRIIYSYLNHAWSRQLPRTEISIFHLGSPFLAVPRPDSKSGLKAKAWDDVFT